MGTPAADEAQQLYDRDKNVIICLIHEHHYDAFSLMVQTGEYPPEQT
jgi:hypothetical protein